MISANLIVVLHYGESYWTYFSQYWIPGPMFHTVVSSTNVPSRLTVSGKLWISFSEADHFESVLQSPSSVPQVPISCPTSLITTMPLKWWAWVKPWLSVFFYNLQGVSKHKWRCKDVSLVDFLMVSNWSSNVVCCFRWQEYFFSVRKRVERRTTPKNLSVINITRIKKCWKIFHEVIKIEELLYFYTVKNLSKVVPYSYIVNWFTCEVPFYIGIKIS